MNTQNLVFCIILIVIVVTIIYLISSEKDCRVSSSIKTRTVFDSQKIDKTLSTYQVQNKYHTKTSKSETIPVYERHDDRVIVLAAPIVSKISLPVHFDARKRWPGYITEVMDQGSCGSCWAFSSCSVFSDRIKIATGGSDLQSRDHISQYHLAACMKCGSHQNNKVCNSVCSGHYMDEVLDYIKKVGGYSTIEINRNSPSNGSQYICFEPKNGQYAKKYKAKSSYRVNPYTVGQLNSRDRRAENEYAIMHEIFKHGPVTTTVKVFDPMSRERIHQNFYFHSTGIFGTGWEKGDPRETDGYHAISIIGWGEEVHNGKNVKYWLIRNSWGDDWGVKGIGKIVRGENRAIVESDIWAMTY
tara:strand:- start:2160 stop:3230 length:1071 start_codon:yes stop_codon:yes gene_type:complete